MPGHAHPWRDRNFDLASIYRAVYHEPRPGLRVFYSFFSPGLVIASKVRRSRSLYQCPFNSSATTLRSLCQPLPILFFVFLESSKPFGQLVTSIRDAGSSRATRFLSASSTTGLAGFSLKGNPPLTVRFPLRKIRSRRKCISCSTKVRIGRD